MSNLSLRSAAFFTVPFATIFTALISCAPAQVGQATVQLKISPAAFTLSSARKETARFGAAGLAPTAYCYFINITGSGLFQTNGKTGAQYATCADGTPNIPGLGQVSGLYAYGDSATLTVSAGDSRRFDLIGVPAASLPGGTCTAKLTLTPAPGVVFGSGDDVLVYLNGVSITNNFDVTLIASGSATINPGTNTVALTAPANPHYGCGGGGDHMNVYPYMNQLSSYESFMSVSCPTGVTKVSATFPTGTTLAGAAASGAQTVSCNLATGLAKFEDLNFSGVSGIAQNPSPLSILVQGQDSAGNAVGDPQNQALGVRLNSAYTRLGSYSGTTFNEVPGQVTTTSNLSFTGQIGHMSVVDDASNAASDKWLAYAGSDGVGYRQIYSLPVTYKSSASNNSNQVTFDTGRSADPVSAYGVVGQAFSTLVNGLSQAELLQDAWSSQNLFTVGNFSPSNQNIVTDSSFWPDPGLPSASTAADNLSAYDNGVLVSAGLSNQASGTTTSFFTSGGISAAAGTPTTPDMRSHNVSGRLDDLLISAPFGETGPLYVFSYGHQSGSGSIKIFQCDALPQCLSSGWKGIEFDTPSASNTVVAGLQFIKSSQTLVVLLRGFSSNIVTSKTLAMSSLAATDFSSNAFKGGLDMNDPRFVDGTFHSLVWSQATNNAHVSFLKALNPSLGDQSQLNQTLMAGGSYLDAGGYTHGIAFRSVDAGANWYLVYDRSASDSTVKVNIADATPLTQRYCKNNGASDDPNCSKSGDSYKPSASFALLESWLDTSQPSQDPSYTCLPDQTNARILIESGSGF